ncbi:BZ3500_MvSof-1268-A1-R1_Chr12-3g04028 [Microbotryum saponariae]|uniref:Histone-lysine N-methyltransferase, H3 lysine-36 specific n=1 Tax=Microbotryum saponariae TaxID=289078 RepID=A0A2X0MK80_9BASI|nr:BZ3500_MvSof-1268-A1-R1_Chr12-3g04028 [Microbotryum saponariae]SDA02564.1 BZ3501_MvSof-1269-A2-R1_Chr12-3g03683 [Microbotryum saponariae]
MADAQAAPNSTSARPHSSPPSTPSTSLAQPTLSSHDLPATSSTSLSLCTPVVDDSMSVIPVASTSAWANTPLERAPPPITTRPRSRSASLASSAELKNPDPKEEDEGGSVDMDQGNETSDGDGDGENKPTAKVEPEEDTEEEEEVKPMRRPAKKTKKVQVVSEPQLIKDLPLAEDQAGRSYTEISDCTYANKSLGNLAYFDEDSTRCECSYTAGFPVLEQACGEESQCVNRLMQIECVAGDCRCGQRCQNQRFQKKEYAKIEIVKTEKKGFGVRATQDMTADTFVYEYVGEVIGPTVFAKRMKDYANEGVKHFYFMALDKDIFIDATKKGGKGRFLNHSCNPNCFVAKWTIGKKMRMGIFTKRSIKANEELTFNYNVDRYGHVAQECYCGEPNCVGFIGGKTQTDIGGMDDLYLDALGIAEEVEALGLRGTKKKKGKKLDEDFLPLLRPIDIDEVPKVSAAVRQSIQTRRILEKILTRIQMTNDPEVLSDLLRLHGFNLMTHILKEYPTDERVITLDLEILTKWELKTRNKVESSKIEPCVKACLLVENKNIQTLAQNLLDYWDSLEMGYRIPRAVRTESTTNVNGGAEADPSVTNGGQGDGGNSTALNERKRYLGGEYSIDQIAKRARAEEEAKAYDLDTPRRPAWVKPSATVTVAPTPPPSSSTLPRGWKKHIDKNSGDPYYENTLTREVQWTLPTKHLIDPAPSSSSSTFHRPSAETVHTPITTKMKAIDVNEIIAQVQREAEAVAVREEKERLKRELELKQAELEQLKMRPSSSLSRSTSSSNVNGHGSASAKDKKVMALFSGVVVQVMSKYKGALDPDQFKKRAKEVTILLCEKEKKHPSYNKEPYDSLTPEKMSKVKAFTKDWIKKLIERKRAQNPNGSGRSKSSSSTPGGTGGASPSLGLDGTSSPSTPVTGAMPTGFDSPNDKPSPRSAGYVLSHLASHSNSSLNSPNQRPTLNLSKMTP